MRTVIFATLFKAAAFITVILVVLMFIQWALGGDAGEDAIRLLRLTSISFALSIFFKIIDILANKKGEEKE